MEKFSEGEHEQVLGDEKAIGAPDIDMGHEPAIQSESAAHISWIGSMPRASFGVMAVVNEDGYLIPLCTANDLLRACKTFWQATYV